MISDLNDGPSAPDTKGDVRRTLRRIVTENGLSICNEPSRVQAYLRDLCPEQRREVFAVVAAIKEGLVSDLQNSAHDRHLLEATITRLASKLFDNTGIIPQTTRWAIESWALALGIIKEPLSSALATPISSATTPSQIHTVPSSIVRARQLTPKASLTLGYEFVEIPSGRFRMGSPSSEPGRFDDEGPQHTVTISRSFLLGTTEVTQGQWKAVMGSNPSSFSSCGDDCPVEKVSWNDVIDFCNRLSDREGLSRCCSGSTWNQSCTGYRLPTEAEWEYAARAGTTTRFACGDSDSCLGGMGWYDGNSGSKTHPVAQKQGNSWGLYDMHGNVWEWVWDWKADYSPGSVTDPTGPSGGSYRVNRGGGWYGSAGDCRSAIRGRNDPGLRYRGLGFRVARSLP